MPGRSLAACLVFAFAACAVVAGGCSGVQPWQRQMLAKPKMQVAPDRLDSLLDEHVYDYREGSSGALGTAGGGCGCN